MPFVPAVVYYVFGDRDRLLYVGMSTNLLVRLGAHAQTAAWWSEVTRVDWVDFYSAAEARQYESEQIRILDPVGNTAGRAIRGETYTPAAP